MLHDFLQESVTILAASVAVILLSARLRIPSVVGFLLTGILIGPSGLALVSNLRQIELFAEIGVVFLLFSIGLEFSLERLKQIRRFFFLGGSLQALLTIAGIGLLAVLAGFPVPRAVFFGFLVTLSSTAIVLKLYADRRELDAPQGKVLIGILLFQDFLIVPMVVLAPVLGGTVEAGPAAVAGRLLAGLAALAAVFGVARYLMPRLLYALVRTRIRELLVLGALTVCLGMAWLTEHLEFSLALGAFLAGIIISESPYSHQVVAEVTPFRDVFNSLFFISIGMLLDVGFAWSRLAMVLALAAAVLGVKAAAAAIAVGGLRLTSRIVILVALSLAQIGEFSFVLLKVGQTHGLVGGELYQLFIAASILTMLATPVLIGLAPRLGEALGWRSHSSSLEVLAPAGGPPLRRHVIVVGYGVNGQNLARVLRAAHIRYVVVELNGELVRQAVAHDEPILFGDATRREILERAGIEAAEVIVFGISDPEAVRRAVRLARELSPAVHIVVRTRLVSELEDLQRLGADEVVAEEFETSIEIFTRVLDHFHVPRNIIRTETRLLRGEGYRMLRSPASPGQLSASLADVLAAGTTDIFRLDTGSPVAGRTIRELGLRRQTGATIIAVVRGEVPQTNPGADFRLEEGDSLVLVGSHAEIDKGFELLERPPAATTAG